MKTPAQERRNTRLSLIAVPDQRLDPALNGAQSQKAEKISIMFVSTVVVNFLYQLYSVTVTVFLASCLIFCINNGNYYILLTLKGLMTQFSAIFSC